jgi:transposase InsO family protein
VTGARPPPILFGMPWKETCAVSERVRLVELVRCGVPVAEVARLLCISRKTAHKWLVRQEHEGRAGLADRSRARHTQPHATCAAVRGILIELRKETGAGPRQLLWLARKRYPKVALPAASTVSSILLKAGLVEPSCRTRRDSDLRGPIGPYRPATKPNEQWTVDFKGQFRLGDRSLCYPLTVQDDATRFLLCVDGHESTVAEGVLSSFRRIFKKHGVPERIHSDNGAPFASTGMGRLSRVSVEWMRQEIEVCRSRPGHPQDNPKHERMHRTLKAKTARPPGATPPSQQRRFGAFVHWMNEERGHEGIGMRAPGEVYRSSKREWQARPKDPEYPGHWEVRRPRSNGDIRLLGHDVFLSDALAGELVGLEEIDDGVWRASYRRSVLCFIDARGESPRVLRSKPKEEEGEETCDG